MKKRNTLLILTLCFAFMLTTTNLYVDDTISPQGHYKNESDTQ